MKRMTLLALALVAAAPVGAQVMLNGAGASFPNIIYQDWILTYNQSHPDVKLNYQSIGSGGGIRQFSDQTVDFGASDVTYNLPGVATGLKLTPDLIADIFLGKVTKWNDARITSVNPGVTLPSVDILVVHRSDGSGTTFGFTEYLSKVSPEWQQKV